MKYDDMSPTMELKLSKVIVSLHPHKQDPSNFRVISHCVRKGWGTVKKIFEEADK